MQDAIKCKIPVTFYHKLSIETWSARGAFEKKNLLFFLYFWLNIDWTLRYNWLNWKSKIYKVIHVGMKVAIIAKNILFFLQCCMKIIVIVDQNGTQKEHPINHIWEVTIGTILCHYL